jgi:hypothetical protein
MTWSTGRRMRFMHKCSSSNEYGLFRFHRLKLPQEPDACASAQCGHPVLPSNEKSGSNAYRGQPEASLREALFAGAVSNEVVLWSLPSG